MSRAGVGRAGFTLAETMIAMLLTAILVMAVFGGLSFIGSGYRRDELAMARSQLATQVLERLGADLAAANGIAMPTRGALNYCGYEGDEKTFVQEVRHGMHVVQWYQHQARQLSAVVELPYLEYAKPGAGGWTYDMPNCRFLASHRLKKAPTPWGVEQALYLVPLPPDDPEVVYLPIRVPHKDFIEQVLWAFFRKRRGPFEAGTIVREGMDSVRYDKIARLIADVKLTNEWVLRTSSREPVLDAVETVLQVELKETRDLALPFLEPSFRTSRSLTVGL